MTDADDPTPVTPLPDLAAQVRHCRALGLRDCRVTVDTLGWLIGMVEGL